jgi:hypothetical protein
MIERLVRIACLGALVVGCSGINSGGPNGAAGTSGAAGGAGPLGGGGAGASGSTSLATPSGFCRAIRAQYAISDARCAGGTVAQVNSPASQSRACDPLDALLAKHTIAYDASLAASCLDMLKAHVATECSPSLDCVGKTLHGLVADGATCTSAAECHPESNCQRADDTTCDLASCAGPGAIGAPCTMFGCVSGAYCDNVIDTCVAIPAGNAGLGADCSDPAVAVCKAGLLCLADPATAGNTFTCQTPGNLCQSDGDCPLDAFCAPVTSTCKPRLPVGAPCTDFPTGCIVLGQCDPITNRCVKAGSDGEPCGQLGVCLDAYCDGGAGNDPGVCVAYKALGDFCQAGHECLSEVCHNGRCTDCPR